VNLDGQEIKMLFFREEGKLINGSEFLQLIGNIVFFCGHPHWEATWNEIKTDPWEVQTRGN
jgi:hypothetical protein